MTISTEKLQQALKVLYAERERIIFENLSRLIGAEVTRENLPEYVGRVAILPCGPGSILVGVDLETVMIFHAPAWEGDKLTFKYKVLR